MSSTSKPIRWWQRPLFAIAGSSLGGWFFRSFTPPIDRILVPLSRGRLSMVMIRPVLILTSTGAKSGQLRTTPLVYLAHDNGIVLIASNGGSPRHPAWYYNLRANPHATVQVNGTTTSCTAREVADADYDTFWRAVVQLYPGYARYQGRTQGRRIPLMILTPRSEP